MRRKLLLINPGFYEIGDYGYYDMPPMGLLKIARYFSNQKVDFDYLDCSIPPRICDTSINLKSYVKDAPFVRMIKCGNFKNEGIMKSQKYYGMPHSQIRQRIRKANPTEIWIGSGLTYYWESIKDIVRICRDELPNTPILLGGIYPTLCPEHANKHIAPDYLHMGALEDIDNLFPDYSVDPNRSMSSIRTIQLGQGCNVNPPCSFCAVVAMSPKFTFLKAESIFNYIKEEYSKGVNFFRFWASQLLVPPERFISLLKLIVSSGIEIKMVASEGVQPSLFNQNISNLMKQAGFMSVSIPMESIVDKEVKDFRKPSDFNDYEIAVANAQRSGFGLIKSFVMVGIPGQNYSDIIHAIVDCWARDVMPAIHQYTPIPGSEDWTKFPQFHSLPIEELHPSLWPGASNDLKVSCLEEIKRIAKIGLYNFADLLDNNSKRYESIIWDLFSDWCHKYGLLDNNKLTYNRPLALDGYESNWTKKVLQCQS